MKKSRVCFVLTAALALGLLSACGGGGTSAGGGGAASGGGEAAAGQSGAEGKVINIYVWSDEWQGKFNDNYPEVDKTSSDKSITYLKDGTEVHWIINPNQDGVYQQKLDEALQKQAGAAADDKIDT